MNAKYKPYKVLGRTTKSKRSLGTYEVPVEALELEADINRIKLAMDLLNLVDIANITSGDADFGWKVKSVTLSQLRTWHRYAQNKLRTEYLAR